MMVFAKPPGTRNNCSRRPSGSSAIPNGPGDIVTPAASRRLAHFLRLIILDQCAKVIDAGRHGLISAERHIAGAEFDVEPGRRVFFLKKLPIENAPVEFRGSLRIGNGESKMLDSGGVKRQIVGTRDAAG